MAVHIFRVRLAGTLLFPEAILSYITFRSTTIYLFKKKKNKNYQFISRECSTKHTPISRDRKKIQKASINTHNIQAMMQRQEEKRPYPNSQRGSFFGNGTLLFFPQARLENSSSQKPHIQSQTQSPQVYGSTDMMFFDSLWDP